MGLNSALFRRISMSLQREAGSVVYCRIKVVVYHEKSIIHKILGILTILFSFLFVGAFFWGIMAEKEQFLGADVPIKPLIVMVVCGLGTVVSSYILTSLLMREKDRNQSSQDQTPPDSFDARH